MALHAILSPASRAFLLAASLLASGLPSPFVAAALAQSGTQSGPKSLLPDDVDTAPLPPPAVGNAAPANTGAGNGSSNSEGTFGGTLATESGGSAFPAEAAANAVPVQPDLPEPEKTDPLAELAGPTGNPALLGQLVPENGGYAQDIFAASQGRYVAALLSRLEAPLASRWAQIVLQRALLTRADAPQGLNPADWVAMRAQALHMIGAGADAHRLVSGVAVSAYTERLYGAAMLSALATADPMALCPLSPTARKIVESPSWDLADAMCLAIMGDDIGATALFDRLRRQERLAPFDIGLAERVASATGAGRRGANPEWGEITELTAWRLGLASAAGLEIEADLLAKMTPAQKGWYVRLPAAPVASRAVYAPEAAAIGAISGAELTRLLAADSALLESGQVGRSAGGELRAARVSAEISDRLKALQKLWGRAPAGSLAHYGWQIASATAAAALPASSGLVAHGPEIAASFLTAGITAPVNGWWKAAEDADSDVRARLWAQLVAVSNQVPVEMGYYGDWADQVSPHRAQLLAAGLQGLGRKGLDVEVPVLVNDWTRALDAAVAAGRTGEVVVLAASGLQGQWKDVPPDYLRRIVAAFVAIGRAGEARMMVAEAANRG